MLRAATEAAAGRMNLLAVTVLTSLNDEDMQEIGVAGRLSDQVLRMAALAQSAGCQGIVTSPREALMVRKAMGEGFAIVTPGIRPAGAETNDQQRTATPAQAISNGVSHIVVGRPITHAADPAKAAQPLFLKWSRQESAGDYVLGLALQYLLNEVLTCVACSSCFSIAASRNAVSSQNASAQDVSSSDAVQTNESAVAQQ